MKITPITLSEQGEFREMLVDYWRDIVPDEPWLTDPVLAEAQFRERYRWDGGSNHPYWAFDGDRRIGFLMFRTLDDNVTVYVHDFFIAADARRQGFGDEMFQKLLSLLRERGISQIQLSVLADNPQALYFWQEQGFEIAYHRLSRTVHRK